MTSTEIEPFAPSEPESLEQTGLSHTLIQQLIVKILYFRGDLYGQDLCRAIGLKFSVIQDIVDALILQHHIQIKRSLGVGHVAALMNLTESGRARAREYLDANQYAGPAPVPITHYTEVVRRQRRAEGWLTKEALQKAFSGMVITERTISQIGPAVCSANSLLIYGKPGDGKTYLVESLNNLESSSIFVPYAIEFQGNIVQVFDPIYHQPLEEDEPSVLAIAVERSHDRRWIRCRPPFIVSGGELSLESLDLSFNRASKVYEAPFQLKANNGLYLIDDFGRQRATPAEVLNRWIVPMERRVDYLSFLTGGKITVPFETFLVFSTNLSPSGLGDEAFLRRIQYKMLLRGPAESEFTRIFEDFCVKRRVLCPPGLVERLLEKRYRLTGKPLRRCHPRDLLSHALNLIHFEKLPYELNDEILDRAFESCFIEEEEELAQTETPAQAAATPAQPQATPSPAPSPVARRTCASYWDARFAQNPSMFGALYQLSSLRAKSGNGYEDAASAREFGAEETSSALARLHRLMFNDWLNLRLSEQMSDLRKFAESSGPWAQIRDRWRELAPSIAPAGATAAEIALFIDDFSTLTTSLPMDSGLTAPAPLQKIA
jgi:hypothetical protein